MITAPQRKENLMDILNKAKELLDQNADKVKDAVEKVGDLVDEKTDGKFADKVDQVQEAVKKKLDEK
ncbi:Hypothetical protein CpMEX30_0075 [Corynebacterium pseudotuberculosis]|nr:Hypothetical protein CpPAT10_0059 [Corynebacterium pseudotuberculosis PAT10]AER68185.1 Hypothetical protein Cp106_0058 [Corynebacterium pseudotuberculosis 1/06-A]AFF21228.1 Hypothetical protein CpP54B96_0063 [Corynebacterium pseudotuberculosis P54B96]AFH50976.1 Hypothetical protein Cp267_0067 [Corynebacterium pseudotuberculosis 267]AJC12800.1 Hypothetical protein CpVD57_0062 [Corynebacterium pseudotuberculosis]